MDSVPTWLLVFVLDLDTSQEAIVEVRRKLQSFRNEILNDPTATKSVELAVIAAGSLARTLVRPTLANRCIIPVLHPTPEANLPETVQASFSVVKARLDYYQQQAITYKKPVLFLLTSHPEGAENALTGLLNDSQEQLLTAVVVNMPGESNDTPPPSTRVSYASWAGFSWAGLATLISPRQTNPTAKSVNPVAASELPAISESAPSERKPVAADAVYPELATDISNPRDWTDHPSPIRKPDEPWTDQAANQEINCSTYAPLSVQPGADFMIVATLHPPGSQTASDTLVKRIDSMLASVSTKSLLEPLRAGQRITFRLLVKGAGIDEPTQEIKWRGNLTSVEFLVSLPASFALPNLYASLSIFRDSVPLGSFKFSLTVSESQTETLRQSPAFQLFRKAFISYSSKDRSEVLKRVQGIEALGQKVFVDLVNLASGERWESRLYQQIETSDVFYLFWSAEAKQSKWVKQEWQYALHLRDQRTNQLPEIIPILIEGPPPPSPPRPLRHLHFNDRYLYFIGK